MCWLGGGRPGGAARPEQWRPRSVASVHCAAGCGLAEAGPCIGPGPDIVRPRYCAANGRGARPEPRTAPHTTAAAALSPVTGGSLLYTLHTATLASADHTAPPVVTRLTSTQHQTHCEVRSSAAWWRGPAKPVFSCRSGGGDRGLKAAVQCHSSTVAAVALC